MREKIITDYDSDFAPAFRVFDSQEFLDSNAKQTAAHSLAIVLFHLKQLLLQKNIEGALQLVEDGLEEIWQHTDVYWEAKTVWKTYLEGNLPPHREPLNLIRKCLSDE